MIDLREKVAVQMYTVRKELAENPEETFKSIKEIGYKAVQIDGMRGHEVEEIAELVKKYDFKIAGMHIKHNRFFDDLDGIKAECEIFGSKTIFDKYIDDEDQNLEGYRKTKKRLVEVAYNLSKEGYRIGLHNPEYDYPTLVDGRNVLQYVTDPVNNIAVYSEPDTYWITCGGGDPVEDIKMYSGRAPMLHFKDFKHGFAHEDMENSVKEVGSGDVDFASIIKWGEANKVEYYCVEQDFSKIGAFNSLQKSFDYLMGLQESL